MELETQDMERQQKPQKRENAQRQLDFWNVPNNCEPPKRKKQRGKELENQVISDRKVRLVSPGAGGSGKKKSP